MRERSGLQNATHNLVAHVREEAFDPVPRTLPVPLKLMLPALPEAVMLAMMTMMMMLIVMMRMLMMIFTPEGQPAMVTSEGGIRPANNLLLLLLFHIMRMTVAKISGTAEHIREPGGQFGSHSTFLVSVSMAILAHHKGLERIERVKPPL